MWTCERCAGRFVRPRAQAARSRHLYCTATCAGAARRTSRAAKVERKREYDARRRAALADQIRAAKAEYHRRTYDPTAAREERKKTAAQMAEYARRYNADPANKAAKAEYDAALRAAKYGEYADAYRLLLELQALVRSMEPDRYLRARARGYYDRDHAQTRKRHDQ